MAARPEPLRSRCPTDAARPGRLPRGTLPALAGGLLLAAAAAVLLRDLFGLGAAVVAVAVVVHLAGAAAVLVGARRAHPPARFGTGNHVTTVRLAVAAAFAGLAVDAARLPADAPALWLPVALALAALALDGVDGRLARRAGTASAFGERYDLEVDAFLILVLALIVWQLGKAGPWVLAIGAMRYAFVLAGRCLPWLRAPLPPSRRRKAWCVVQVSVLCALLSPWFVPPWSPALALVALAGLTGSFAADLRWLSRRRRLTAGAARAAGRAGHRRG
ncbi:CDP-alcohol phosphatidyltransferase family protein [Coralloluteibacterium thermophilus]|uniref:CDP-alcohol phosphatidyltransferase family protein n=1 Tax=Coralloluteibacterium thermophilum TaxID=2707049 RepID=A0ABV9NPT3_9GAMM